MNVQQPTIQRDRIVALDVLRGLALFGILVANMLHFQSPYLYVDPHTFYATPVDELTFKWIDILVEGSFYPIFAMLFGYGINLQYERSIKKGNVDPWMMVRRFSILMLFGLVHAIFIWSGDILFTYALFGFAMIILVRLPRHILFGLSIVTYVIPALLLFFITRLITLQSGQHALTEFVDIQKIELAITAYAHGTYWEALQFRLGEWLVYGLLNSLFSVFIILPLIMLGAAMSKYRWIETAALRWKRLVVFASLTGVGGFYIKALPYTIEPRADLDLMQTLFGGPLVALCYMSLVLLLMKWTITSRIVQPFAAVGKMSLTVYVTQSIVATLIFYNYGLGLYGVTDLSTGTWLALGIYAIQVILANVWLSKYRQGPLEALWRKGTYRTSRN